MWRDGLASSGSILHEESICACRAACSSVAFAAEVKKDKAHIPAVKATTMSDAQMDKVTAGSNGIGNAFAFGHMARPANEVNNGRDPH